MVGAAVLAASAALAAGGLLAASAAAASPYDQAAPRRIIFEDTFASNGYQWPTTARTASGVIVRNFFDESGYHIVIPDQPTHYPWYISSATMPEESDVTAEMDVRAVDGPVTGWFGLSVRTNGTHADAYLLLVTGDQRFMLTREGVDRDLPLIRPTRTDVLKAGTEPNLLKLVAYKNWLAVFFNGQRVARIQDAAPGAYTRSGSVMPRVENSMHVVLRRLTVTASAEEDVAETPPASAAAPDMAPPPGTGDAQEGPAQEEPPPGQ